MTVSPRSTRSIISLPVILQWRSLATVRRAVSAAREDVGDLVATAAARQGEREQDPCLLRAEILAGDHPRLAEIATPPYPSAHRTAALNDDNARRTRAFKRLAFAGSRETRRKASGDNAARTRSDHCLDQHSVRSGIGHYDVDSRQLEVRHRCKRAVGRVFACRPAIDMDSVAIDMSERAEIE